MVHDGRVAINARDRLDGANTQAVSPCVISAEETTSFEKALHTGVNFTVSHKGLTTSPVTQLSETVTTPTDTDVKLVLVGVAAVQNDGGISETFHQRLLEGVTQIGSDTISVVSSQQRDSFPIIETIDNPTPGSNTYHLQVWGTPQGRLLHSTELIAVFVRANIDTPASLTGSDTHTTKESGVSTN